MRKWAKDVSYDVYIPDYTGERSLLSAIAYFGDFISGHQLEEYRELYVFGFILGTWILNLYLVDEELSNLVAIVYDRSPLQEQAPRIVIENLPLLSQIFFGDIQLVRRYFVPIHFITHYKY